MHRQNMRRRRLTRPLVVLGLVYLMAWAVMTGWPQAIDAWARTLIPAHAGDLFVRLERLRWAGLCLFNLLLIGLYLLCVKAGARRAQLSAAALLLAHAATQLFFLRAAFETDYRAPYLERPALFATVPRSRVPTRRALGRGRARPPRPPFARQTGLPRRSQRRHRRVDRAAGSAVPRRRDQDPPIAGRRDAAPRP